jgi:pyruvate,water dikinase
MALSASPSTGPALLWGQEALEAAEDRLGGKALGLARLLKLGVEVPPWFVIPTEHFEAHLALGGPEDLEQRPLDSALRRAVAEALARLGPGPFAVRSSMVGEDSSTRSFAGQLDTFLFQRTHDEVLDAVRRCWKSAFGARAVAYRQRAPELPASTPKMAVVVQQMIAGEVSGVVFTANPITHRRDQLLVSACWGLGEGIVSGLCDTDEFVCGHDGALLSSQIAQKSVEVVANPGGAGTQEADIPLPRATEACLTPDQVREVCTQALKAAAGMGSPQDIEWTFAGGRLYLLQSRPITSLQAAAAPPTAITRDTGAPRQPLENKDTEPPRNRGAPRVVWDNSNIQESYCGVTTPLTFSFAAGAYASVHAQIMRALGLSEQLIAEHQPQMRNLLGLIRGRVYYNINNWYRMLLLLPSFGRNKADMEHMLGLDPPVDFIEDQRLSLGEKLQRLPGALALLARLLFQFSRLDADVDRFEAEFEASYRAISDRDLAGASFSELMTYLEAARVTLLERWHTPFVNDLYVMMTSGRLRRRVQGAMGQETPQVVNDLLAGEEGIASAEPTRRLMALAKLAQRTPALGAALTQGVPTQALQRARESSPEFGAQLDEFLDRYGDRCMGELKLETLSLRQDPSFVVQVLRNYLHRPDLDPERWAARERERRLAAEARVRSRLSFWGAWRLGRELQSSRKAIKAREATRLSRTRAYGLYRMLYLAIGQRLHEAGRLDHPRDVFYLTTSEIRDYHEGIAASVDLASIARARLAEFRRYEAETLPNRFETVGPAGHDHGLAAPAPTATEQAQALLKGLGCSAGKVEAPLRVVHSPNDDLNLDGRILTALRTDPGWSPLFPSASAILVERGSTLSHSAVLARELGIPAVVGIPNLLRIVRDGERVRLDGSAGTVERLEAK